MRYLVHVYDTKDDEVRLKDVQMVQNFPNVFLDELLGLPLERKMEFAINVIPRTYLISLPSNKMAPIKLKELKTQL